MPGYIKTRPSSVPATQRSSIATTIERMQRAADAVERAYADVSPKPEQLYNQRMRRTLPIHERHFRELDGMVKRGANPAEIMTGVESMLCEFEGRYAPPATLCLDTLHDDEFSGESEANPVQLKARITRSVADLRAAIAVTDKEIMTAKALRRGLVALLDQKALLEAHTQPVAHALQA